MEEKDKNRAENKNKEGEANTAAGLVESAEQQAKNGQEISRVKRLYEQAADKVESIADLRKIARSIPVYIKDKEFEKEIYLRVLARTRSKEDYIMYTQLMAFFLKDNEFSQKLCANIEAIFLSKRKLEEAYKGFTDMINGLTPQQKMAKFAGFLSKFKMNKYIKDIYFKAAKEFSQINKREALIAYLKYYQLSFREDSKAEAIPDRVVKTIFKNTLEYEAFLKVVDTLRQDSDFGAALTKIDDRYRKKIELNNTRIDNIKSQHEGTVDKLNEILEDNDKEKNIKVEKEKRAVKEGKEPAAAVWSSIQKEFLSRFVQNGFALSKQETAEFVKSKNLFESQFIDGINESFLDAFDDMLIEEEETRYIINPEHKKHLTSGGTAT
jgi:hypothetical protein